MVKELVLFHCIASFDIIVRYLKVGGMKGQSFLHRRWLSGTWPGCYDIIKAP